MIEQMPCKLYPQLLYYLYYDFYEFEADIFNIYYNFKYCIA